MPTPNPSAGMVMRMPTPDPRTGTMVPRQTQDDGAGSTTVAHNRRDLVPLAGDLTAVNHQFVVAPGVLPPGVPHTLRGSLPGSALARETAPTADFRSRVMSNAIQGQADRDIEHRLRAEEMTRRAQRDAEAVGTTRRAPSPPPSLRGHDHGPPRATQRLNPIHDQDGLNLIEDGDRDL